MYVVYILKSHNCSYIGMTNDFFRRWKQHNGILQGGATYTKKYNDWLPICIIDGFKTKQEAMQCEWRLKRGRGYLGRIRYLSHYLNFEKQWTKNSPDIKSQELSIYIKDEYKKYLTYPSNELYW
jgi:predicted GIY-YIG superfamily endonuclease